MFLFFCARRFGKRIITLIILAIFALPSWPIYANNINSPASVVNLRPASAAFSYPVLKGIRFDPADPLRLKFVIDCGDHSGVSEAQATRLVNYFLAGLTMPQDELWVNLSPYEKERIAENDFAVTDLGKDMLEQDYILKQLAASLTYPEAESGKSYWNDILGRGGSRTAPTNTFNKVWIMPDKASVYESSDGSDNRAVAAFVGESKLKVLTQDDYLAMKNAVIANEAKQSPRGEASHSQPGIATPRNGSVRNDAVDAFKKHILPLIENDVNRGKNFARLRQIYNSLVLAVWFKQKFKDSFYKAYIDRKKIRGVDKYTLEAKEKIYQEYLAYFKQGAYSVIQKSKVKSQNFSGSYKVIKRQYFSGGCNFRNMPIVIFKHVFRSASLAGPAMEEEIVLEKVGGLSRALRRTAATAGLFGMFLAGFMYAPQLSQGISGGVRSAAAAQVDGATHSAKYAGKSLSLPESLQIDVKWQKAWQADFLRVAKDLAAHLKSDDKESHLKRAKSQVETYISKLAENGYSLATDLGLIKTGVDGFDNGAKAIFAIACLANDDYEVQTLGGAILADLVKQPGLHPLLVNVAKILTHHVGDRNYSDVLKLSKGGGFSFDPAALERQASLPFWQWMFQYRLADIGSGTIDLAKLQAVLGNDNFQKSVHGKPQANTLSLARKILALTAHSKMILSSTMISEAVKVIVAHDRAIAKVPVAQDGTVINFVSHRDMESDTGALSDYLGKNTGVKIAKSYTMPSGKNSAKDDIGPALGMKNSIIDPKTGAIAKTPFNPKNNIWWFNEHGSEGGEHLWHHSRGDVQKVGEDLKTPDAISNQEMHDALVARALRLQGDNHGRLDDMIIVLDSCFSADFAANLLTKLAVSLQKGEIKSLPVVVASANKGTTASGQQMKDGEDRAQYGMFAQALLSVLKKGKPFNFSIFDEMEEITSMTEDIAVFVPTTDPGIINFVKKYCSPDPAGNAADKLLVEVISDAMGNKAKVKVSKSESGYIGEVSALASEGAGKIGDLHFQPMDNRAQIDNVARALQRSALAGQDNQDNPGLLDFFTRLLERAPPLYVYPERIRDIFGLAPENQNMTALYQGIINLGDRQRAIAYWHELGHKAIQREELKLSFTFRHGNPVLAVYRGAISEDNLVGVIGITDKTAKKLARQSQKDKEYQDHYLLRALQRQIFGEADVRLTEDIIRLQSEPVAATASGNPLGGVDMRAGVFNINTYGSVAASSGKSGYSLDEYDGLRVKQVTLNHFTAQMVDNFFGTQIKN